MDPSCLVSTAQAAGGVMVWGIFAWHTLGPLVPTEHRLNATAYLSIVADHVHPFRTTVYPSSDGFFRVKSPLFTVYSAFTMQIVSKHLYSDNRKIILAAQQL